MGAATTIFAFFLFLGMFLIVLSLPSLFALAGLRVLMFGIEDKRDRLKIYGFVALLLVLIPFGLNKLNQEKAIEIVRQNHGILPLKSTPQKIAVFSQNYRKKHNLQDSLICNYDCLEALISKSVDSYLTFDTRGVRANTPAIAYSLETHDVCDTSDIQIPSYPGKDRERYLKTAILDLSMQGTCLISRPAYLGQADIVVDYEVSKKSSLITGRAKIISQVIYEKSVANEFAEVYRENHVTYNRFIAIFFPILIFDKNGIQFDLAHARVGHDENGRRPLPKFYYRRLNHAPLKTPEVLGTKHTQDSLEEAGLIPDRKTQVKAAQKLVNSRIIDDRLLSKAEWDFIERQIKNNKSNRDWDANRVRLVATVLASSHFPVPDTYLNIKTGQKQLTKAALARIEANSLGPDIYGDLPDRLWRRVYTVINAAPKELLEPHFETLLNAAKKRDYDSYAVSFLTKFGRRSIDEIVPIIRSERRSLKGLSKTICDMAPQMQTYKDDIYGWINETVKPQYAPYSNLIYTALVVGIDKETLYNTISPDTPFGDYRQRQMEQVFENFDKGQYRCRS